MPAVGTPRARGPLLFPTSSLRKAPALRVASPEGRGGAWTCHRTRRGVNGAVATQSGGYVRNGRAFRLRPGRRAGARLGDGQSGVGGCRRRRPRRRKGASHLGLADQLVAEDRFHGLLGDRMAARLTDRTGRSNQGRTPLMMSVADTIAPCEGRGDEDVLFHHGPRSAGCTVGHRSSQIECGPTRVPTAKGCCPGRWQSRSAARQDAGGRASNEGRQTMTECLCRRGCACPESRARRSEAPPGRLGARAVRKVSGAVQGELCPEGPGISHSFSARGHATGTTTTSPALVAAGRAVGGAGRGQRRAQRGRPAEDELRCAACDRPWPMDHHRLASTGRPPKRVSGRQPRHDDGSGAPATP